MRYILAFAVAVKVAFAVVPCPPDGMWAPTNPGPVTRNCKDIRPGFWVSGAITRVCGATGAWEPEDASACREPVVQAPWPQFMAGDCQISIVEIFGIPGLFGWTATLQECQNFCSLYSEWCFGFGYSFQSACKLYTNSWQVAAFETEISTAVGYAVTNQWIAGDKFFSSTGQGCMDPNEPCIIDWAAGSSQWPMWDPKCYRNPQYYPDLTVGAALGSPVVNWRLSITFDLALTAEQSDTYTENFCLLAGARLRLHFDSVFRVECSMEYRLDRGGSGATYDIIAVIQFLDHNAESVQDSTNMQMPNGDHGEMNTAMGEAAMSIGMTPQSVSTDGTGVGRPRVLRPGHRQDPGEFPPLDTETCLMTTIGGHMCEGGGQWVAWSGTDKALVTQECMDDENCAAIRMTLGTPPSFDTWMGTWCNKLSVDTDYELTVKRCSPNLVSTGSGDLPHVCSSGGNEYYAKTMISLEMIEAAECFDNADGKADCFTGMECGNNQYYGKTEHYIMDEDECRDVGACALNGPEPKSFKVINKAKAPSGCIYHVLTNRLFYNRARSNFGRGTAAGYQAICRVTPNTIDGSTLSDFPGTDFVHAVMHECEGEFEAIEHSDKSIQLAECRMAASELGFGQGEADVQYMGRGKAPLGCVYRISSKRVFYNTFAEPKLVKKHAHQFLSICRRPVARPNNADPAYRWITQ